MSRKKAEYRDIRTILKYLPSLPCFKCPYQDKCLSEYAEYLIRCRYIENWVINVYRKLREEK